MHLKTEQHGAYFLLIMAYWKNRGPLSSDAETLASICRLTKDAWSNHQAVLEQFFDSATNEGFWVHHRIEKELAAATAKKEKNVNRAKNAALVRHGQKKTCLEQSSSIAPSNRQAVLGQCPSPSPSQEDNKRDIAPGERIVQQVISLWNEKAGCLPVTILSPLQTERLLILLQEHSEIGWWENLFASIKESMPHLQGDNDRQWRAGLGWVVDSANWANVINGQYISKRGRKDGASTRKNGGAKQSTHAHRVVTANFDPGHQQHSDI